MTTIQDFPTELLCSIFQMVQGRDRRPRTSASLSYFRSRLRSLVTLSLVCKGWHKATLEYGILWSSVPVDTSRPDCLESTSTILERSSGAELELSVYLDAFSAVFGCTQTILGTLKHHGTRIRSLHLDAGSHCIPGRGTQLPEVVTNAFAAINEFILPELHPSTQRAINPFQSLSSLSLSLPASAAAVNATAILGIINSCVGLERLSLVSFYAINKDCPPTSAIRMPNLLRVSLRDCDSATVLSYIITPTTSVIDVVMNPRSMRRSPAHAHILVAFPHSPANTCALKESTKLILEEDENRHEFSLGLGPLRSKTSSLVITNRCPPSERFIPRTLSAIAAHPYFGAIRSFTFSCTSCAPASWPLVLDGFPLLSEFNTSVRHASDVMCALMHTRPDRSPICLFLERIRFRAHWGGEGHGIYPQSVNSFRQFRAELHCSAVRITLHYPGGMKEL